MEGGDGGGKKTEKQQQQQEGRRILTKLNNGLYTVPDPTCRNGISFSFWTLDAHEGGKSKKKEMKEKKKKK